MINLLVDFLFSGAAAMGFAIFFNIPRRAIPLVGITGGAGWVCSVLISKLDAGAAWPYLFGSIAVSFLAEIFARKTHSPSTLFSIPGIYPLVPGYGLYKTMDYFTGGDVSQGVTVLLSTMKTSGAIAVGIITMSSIWNINKRINKKKNRIKISGENSESYEDSFEKIFE